VDLRLRPATEMPATQALTEWGQGSACPPSPTSDSEDFANAFDDICLSALSPSTSDDDLSSFFSDASDSDTSVDSFDKSICPFCHSQGKPICSLCSHLCDDYATTEFAAFRLESYPAFDLDPSPAVSCRIRTTPSQRQLLESVLEPQRPPSNDKIISLLQFLGPDWNKARVLKWYDNRRFRKHQRPVRDLCLKKKISTTAREKLLLEVVFSTTPFPRPEELDLLRENLCAIRRGWSHRRVVQWFTNRRKQKKSNDCY